MNVLHSNEPLNVECKIRMFILCNKMMYFGDFVVLAA